QCDELVMNYCQRNSPAGEGMFGDGGVLEQAFEALKTAVRQPAALPGMTQDSAQQVTLASGNLMLWLRLPGSGPYDPLPALTYNSRDAGNSSEFGAGW